MSVHACVATGAWRDLHGLHGLHSLHNSPVLGVCDASDSFDIPHGDKQQLHQTVLLQIPAIFGSCLFVCT